MRRVGFVVCARDSETALFLRTLKTAKVCHNNSLTYLGFIFHILFQETRVSCYTDYCVSSPTSTQIAQLESSCMRAFSTSGCRRAWICLRPHNTATLELRVDDETCHISRHEFLFQISVDGTRFSILEPVSTIQHSS